MNDHLLELTDLTIECDTPSGRIRTVDRLNLVLRSGEILGLIGESGSGKTSVVRGILGLLAKNCRLRGTIKFRGEKFFGGEINRLRELRGKQIGLVFQNATSSLNPVTKVGNQLHEILRSSGVSQNRARDVTLQATLRGLGFENPDAVMNSYPHQLSGGMAQRIAIAMASVTRASIILADECTSALDVTTQAEVVQLLRANVTGRSAAMIFVTHDLRLASEVCSNIAVMYAGQIVEEGVAETVIRQPSHRYTAALLRAIPTWSARKSSLQGIEGSPPEPQTGVVGCRFAARCQFAHGSCATGEIEWTATSSGGYRCRFPATGRN